MFADTLTGYTIEIIRGTFSNVIFIGVNVWIILVETFYEGVSTWIGFFISLTLTRNQAMQLAIHSHLYCHVKGSPVARAIYQMFRCSVIERSQSSSTLDG